jgi:TatD DNase family protein
MLFGDRMKIADSHAHLNFPDYEGDREEVIKRAREGKVLLIINIGSGEGIEGIKNSLEIARSHNFIYTTIGIHPHEAGIMDFKELLPFFSEEKVVGVGECGLDFYKNYSPREKQIDVFKRQIDLAMDKKLPLVIHSRNAMDEILKIMEEKDPWKNGVLFHCFSGDESLAMDIVKRGGFISFAGNITYRDNEAVRSLIRRIPDERILLETDCPFLSPVPYRGKRNEPLYIWMTADFAGKVRGITAEDMGRISFVNTVRFFRIPYEIEPSIVYKIRRSLYINLTNECTLSCTFCGKRRSYFVKGHYLKLEREPSVDEVLSEINSYKRETFDEVVFCGYGEPLLRLDKVKEIAKALKSTGIKTRIDTDGLANLIHKRNIVPELSGLIDSISISLNAPDEETYAKICPSPYGKEAWKHVCEFVRECKKYISEVVITAVSLPSISSEDMEKLAESLGVKFRMREFNEIG